MANIVGIRFKNAGKIYNFDAGELDIQPDEYVVVRTARGMELGWAVPVPARQSDSEDQEEISPVIRKATEEDFALKKQLEEKTGEAFTECGKMIAELNLPMKLLTAEYNLDSSRLTFLFSAEERVDFRDLVRKLTARFKIRVELRQVGSRDEAKLLGSYGRCGRNLCCAGFLTEFTPVSIKMAKEQDLPLNPMKISGACGRLMCCLAFEAEQYRAMKSTLPRPGTRVTTKMGEGTVLSSNLLRETVTLNMGESEVTMPLKDVTIPEKH